MQLPSHPLKLTLLAIMIAALASLAIGCAPRPAPAGPGGPGSRFAKAPARRTPPPMAEPADTKIVSINNVTFEVDSDYDFFTWSTLPSDVDIQRLPRLTFTNVSGETHAYEVVHVTSGNLNWYQAAFLAQDAGGYLVSITSEQENAFVFGLVNHDKYFWHFPKYDGSGRMNHHEIAIGPFIGGYQPLGAAEPDGGWRWLSGEPMTYTNWAKNLDDGVIDMDPRDNTQPNDSGNSKFGQRVMGFGEMNKPVPTWGDYMDGVATYGKERTPGRSYAFIIEYENKAD